MKFWYDKGLSCVNFARVMKNYSFFYSENIYYVFILMLNLHSSETTQNEFLIFPSCALFVTVAATVHV